MRRLTLITSVLALSFLTACKEECTLEIAEKKGQEFAKLAEELASKDPAKFAEVAPKIAPIMEKIMKSPNDAQVACDGADEMLALLK